MAQQNHQFEKRKREMEKKAKKEEKRLRKLNKDNTPAAAEDETTTAPAPESV